MFFNFSLHWLSKQFPLALSRNFIPEFIQTNFYTEMPVYLVGFEKEIKKQLSYIVEGPSHSLYRSVVVDEFPKVYHSFIASLNSAEIKLTDPNDVSQVKEHFKQSKKNMAIYCILSDEDLLGRSYKIVVEDPNLVVIKFAAKIVPKEPQQAAYTIGEILADVLSSIFGLPISNYPIASFKSANLTAYTIAHTEEVAKSAASLVKENVDPKINAEVLSLTYDKGINIVCGICEDSECVAEWLRKSPEYATAKNSNSQLSLFVLPETCPSFFVYGDESIAFAPNGDKTLLRDALYSSLYSIKPFGQMKSFNDLLKRRNTLINPLRRLVKNMTSIIESIREIHSLGLEFANQNILDTLDGYVSSFKEKQLNITGRYLQGENIDEQFEDLEKIVSNAWFMWSTISGRVKKKRVCVANNIDVSKSPFFLKRPSVLALICVIVSIFMFKYAFSRMRAKTVLKILSAPSPLL